MTSSSPCPNCGRRTKKVICPSCKTHTVNKDELPGVMTGHLSRVDRRGYRDMFGYRLKYVKNKEIKTAKDVKRLEERTGIRRIDPSTAEKALGSMARKREPSENLKKFLARGLPVSPVREVLRRKRKQREHVYKDVN